MGRTARGLGGAGHALLILRPEELGFLRYLKQAKVPLNEFEFSWSKIADIQLQVCIDNDLLLPCTCFQTKYFEIKVCCISFKQNMFAYCLCWH